MGFFENYDDGRGARFFSKEEKDGLIESGETLLIDSISKGAGKFGPRYVVRVVTSEGEERALSFSVGAVESRDRLLDAMIDYLGDEGAEPPKIRLAKVGNCVLVQSAEEG